ncbi:MAG: hypothetical protein RLY72_223 [Planctomycetota bacterium]
MARVLAELGCEVCISDDVARKVLEMPEVCAAIIARAGSSVALSGGAIERSALARAMFSDRALRADIEAIMHPRIEALRRAQFAAAPASSRAFVIDAPLLFEVGLDRECAAVIFVDTPRALRLSRVAESRGWDDAELARREASQLALEEKRGRSSDVVENHGDRARLNAEVARVFEAILSRCADVPRAQRT